MQDKLTQAVIDWVSTLDSHSIYDAAKVAAEYTDKTGNRPCWREHSTEATRAAIARRGLGGHVKDSKTGCAYGYEIAAALALVFCNGYQSPMMGRGSLFRDCIAQLQSKLKQSTN